MWIKLKRNNPGSWPPYGRRVLILYGREVPSEVRMATLDTRRKPKAWVLDSCWTLKFTAVSHWAHLPPPPREE